MNIGILVTARLGSSRLRRKHLLQVGGKPLIAYLLARINAEFAREIAGGTAVMVIASSDEPENRDFECFTTASAQVFFGANDNIPLRHLQVAEALGLDAIVGVDGDDILCSTRGMRSVYTDLVAGKQYVRTVGLPFGMNSFGYATGFLGASLTGHRQNVLETGWGKIFDEAAVTEVRIEGLVADDRLRFTLDYEEDYQFFSEVIMALGDRIESAGDEEIVELVNQNGCYRLNENIAQEYWANFYRCMEREKGM